jgi:hypothetical protein
MRVYIIGNEGISDDELAVLRLITERRHPAHPRTAWVCPRHCRTKVAPVFSTMPGSKERAPFSNSPARICRRRCHIPFCFEAAIFSRMRSPMTSRSNCAKDNRTVRDDGFEYEGRHYRSLTVIAERITGAHWSGPRFFGVSKRARTP